MCFESNENDRYSQIQLEKFNRYLTNWQETKSLEEYFSGFNGFRGIRTFVEMYNAKNNESV